MGTRASIRLDHPDSAAIAGRVQAEIDRLESIFSLFRADSALSRLNRDGALTAPPFELLDCLTIAGAVHRASGGLFDPTVQPLWALWAESMTQGHQPDDAQIAAALARTGWPDVTLTPGQITLRPGMALTLNGIAQGYVADRVAALLEGEGLSQILIDTGEFRALGGQPDGADWPVKLVSGGQIGLRQRALATSSPVGTSFDQDGRFGHILDPRTGRPGGRGIWQSVSVTAPSAALADALSTAACLTPEPQQVHDLLAQFPDARFEALQPA